mmetsp:Transcript_77128/g.152882  ORF Transcript_77128/g.152882 Transcript_77128/m.152882 type:complete len:102 (+) Transcript_77128:394-699(+)
MELASAAATCPLWLLSPELDDRVARLPRDLEWLLLRRWPRCRSGELLEVEGCFALSCFLRRDLPLLLRLCGLDRRFLILPSFLALGDGSDSRSSESLNIQI